MSNRDSLGYGDLLPQDVVDIFAQEKHSKKGRKQQGNRSIGRALGWLKGKKKKNLGDKAQNPGLGPALDLALAGRPAGSQGAPKGTPKTGRHGHQQSNSNAVPKRDDDDNKTPAPIVLQENVFIEASRPKYLEDLHSEALEGLKLMQQDERVLGPEYHDNESTISTVSARAEVDGGGFTTDSTLPDASSMVSVQSSVSSRSSRSGLTRQGSTFRPLNSGKKSDKSRTRRRHRRTTGSIPQHLQREFGLDRAEWTVSPQVEEEFLNGESESDVPQLAVHSPPETSDTEVPPMSSAQKEREAALVADMMTLQQNVGTAPSGGDRSRSLAVPGMTTAGSAPSGPPSPVMSMSPQAPYLSTIIPNAVLPPSIDVVEISRGSSRNSVRTVSKSSLMLSSPTSSRASSRASTARSTSSRASTLTSASRQKNFALSDSSCWSNSDSDTLVSDSSTISSSSTPRQRENKETSKKQNKVSVHTDASKGTSNGRMTKAEDSKKDGAFARSLSVMKPKRAPPPPSRSYSLHNKMKRRSRDLADVKIIPNQTNEGNMKKIIDSPGYNADTSSLDESTGSKTPSPLKSHQNVDSTQNNISVDALHAKKEESPSNNHSKVISPSSGYSSQDAMSPSNSSPKHKKGLLAKLHKLFPASTTAEVSTSVISKPDVSKTSEASVITVSEKPSVKALRELFSIPPHPKVHAPPPPPPEVWSNSPRSIELLLGPPAPENTYTIVKKNPKDKRPYRQSPSTCLENAVRISVEEQRPRSNITVESKMVHVSQEGSVNVENSERLMQTNVDAKENGKVQSAILNGVLVRTVERDAHRLPAIAEEHKSSTQNTKNPSISPAHISPQTLDVTNVVLVKNVASPEASWPPPPPPVSQASTVSPDETDFPLPPPPDILVDEIVIPVQVPSDNNAPPLNIPPPPSYTAPPPPIKTFSEKLKITSSHSKELSPPSPKATTSDPKAEVKPQDQHKSSPPKSPVPAPKLSAIPSPPEAPPTPPRVLIIEVPPSNVSPPPDLIPPSPKQVIMMPSIVADLPSQTSEVSPPPTDITCEPNQSTFTNSVTTTEVITEVSVLQPADIPIPTVIVSKPPPKVETLIKEAPSLAKETPPPLPDAAVPSPLVEVTPVPIVVSDPPSEECLSTPLQVEVTQTLVEISIKPEVSIPSEDVSIHPSKEEDPQSSEVIPDKPVEEPAPAPIAITTPIELVSPPVEVAPPKPPSNENPKETPPSTEVTETCKVEETSTALVEKSPEGLRIPLSHNDSDPVLEKPTPKEEIDLSKEDVLIEADSNRPPWKSILTPPQSIPPPPPMGNPTPNISTPNEQKEAKEEPSKDPNQSQEVPSNESIEPEEGPSIESIKPEDQRQPEISPTEPTTPPQEAEAIAVSSPPTEEVPQQEPSPDVKKEHQNKEPAPETTPPQEAEVIAVSSLPTEEVPKPDINEETNKEPAPETIKEALSKNADQTNDAMINGNQESPKVEDTAESEAKTTTQKQETTSEVQTSTTPEAPQKPIRKSLIIISPPSPSATVSTSPTLLKAPPSTTVTTNKSPTTIAPSMNLQEAIRLRTAARTQNGPMRLSIHSPPGFDVRKSPTSTASFIFSKSNKKMVIETRSEAKAEKKTEITKTSPEQKKEFKVPPPVAKKPKTKTKEAESGDTVEHNASSDATKDNTKKPNGTAGTVGGQ